MSEGILLCNERTLLILLLLLLRLRLLLRLLLLLRILLLLRRLLLLLLLLLILWPFGPKTGRNLSVAGILRQLIFYVVRISAQRHTCTLEGQVTLFLCGMSFRTCLVWLALQAARLSPVGLFCLLALQ